MGKQCFRNSSWKKLRYPENSGLYLIPKMQLKTNALATSTLLRNSFGKNEIRYLPTS
jgi:hypothetical protein